MAGLYTDDSDAGLFEGGDHLVGGSSVGDEHMEIFGLADAPVGYDGDLAVIDDGDATVGELDHGGVESGFVGAEAAGAPGGVDPVGSDEEGVDDYPRFSKFLDQSLSPDIDQVARALARKFRWRIQPSGATALNFLGLSTQVPAVPSIFRMAPIEPTKSVILRWLSIFPLQLRGGPYISGTGHFDAVL